MNDEIEKLKYHIQILMGCVEFNSELGLAVKLIYPKSSLIDYVESAKSLSAESKMRKFLTFMSLKGC